MVNWRPGRDRRFRNIGGYQCAGVAEKSGKNEGKGLSPPEGLAYSIYYKEITPQTVALFPLVQLVLIALSFRFSYMEFQLRPPRKQNQVWSRDSKDSPGTPSLPSSPGSDTSK